MILQKQKLLQSTTTLKLYRQQNNKALVCGFQKKYQIFFIKENCKYHIAGSKDVFRTKSKF